MGELTSRPPVHTVFFSWHIFSLNIFSLGSGLWWVIAWMTASSSPLTEMEIAEAKNGQVSNVCRNIFKAPSSQSNSIKPEILWLILLSASHVDSAVLWMPQLTIYKVSGLSGYIVSHSALQDWKEQKLFLDIVSQ